MRIEQDIADLLQPVASLEGLLEVMAEMGHPIPRPQDLIPPEITGTVDAVRALVFEIRALATGLADGDPTDTVIADSLRILNRARDVMAQLQALEEIDAPALPRPWNDPGTLADLARNLPGYLLWRWLRDHHPVANAIADFLDLWSFVAPPDAPGQPARRVWRLDVDQINRFVTEPLPALAGLVTTDGEVDLRRLIFVIQTIMRELGLRPPARALVLEDGIWREEPVARDALFGVRLLPPVLDDLTDITVTLDADRSGAELGLAVSGGVQADLALAADWRLSAGVGGQGALAFRYAPSEGITPAPGQPSAAGHLALTGRPAEPWRILGFGEGARLTLDGVEARIAAALSGSTPELEIGLTMDGLRLSVDLSEGDSFITEALPLDGFEIAFGAALGWSLRDGLNLTANGPADIVIPVNLTFGPIKVPKLEIGFRPDADGLRVPMSVAASAELGILRASVDGIGVSLELTRSDGSAGLLGGYDLRFAFRPPTGIGFGIGSEDGPISGGGYLSADHAAGEYAGLLDLQIVKIGITAIAIIDTRALDSGQWSMFFALFIELPSIQLGFGISLEGVGGVAGINRTLDAEALLEAVRSGAIDTVLFPENPIADAPIIIDTFRQLFPPAQGRYVFGPVVKIGWAKGIALAELGVVIELPDPVVVAILGSVKVSLPPLPVPGAEEAGAEAAPDDEVPLSIIDLRLDIAGIFDFGAGTIAFDGYLHDSSIAGFPISGGTSLRASFKGNRSFILAIGGFHPGFPQPEGFPLVPRLEMALSIGGVVEISFASYFAVTSNTIQFGAAIFLSADIEIFAIEGGLVFDALIETNPLRVDFALDTHVSVSAVGVDLLAVRLAGTAVGPKPWVITALAEVNLLGYRDGIEIHYSTEEVDTTPPVPPIDVLPLVIAALSEPAAWEAEAPADTGVLLAEPGTDAAPHIAPNATLTLAQTVAPLNTVVDRHGRNENILHDRFELEIAAPQGASITTFSDAFAPGMFRDLGASDQSRLSAPSFEDMPAGQSITAGLRTGPVRSATLAHKVSLLDPDLGINHASLPGPSPASLSERLDGDLSEVLSVSIGETGVLTGLGPIEVGPVTHVAVAPATGAALGPAGSFMAASAGAGGAAIVRTFEREIGA